MALDFHWTLDFHHLAPRERVNDLVNVDQSFGGNHVMPDLDLGEFVQRGVFDYGDLWFAIKRGFHFGFSGSCRAALLRFASFSFDFREKPFAHLGLCVSGKEVPCLSGSVSVNLVLQLFQGEPKPRLV